MTNKDIQRAKAYVDNGCWDYFHMEFPIEIQDTIRQCLTQAVEPVIAENATNQNDEYAKGYNDGYGQAQYDINNPSEFDMGEPTVKESLTVEPDWEAVAEEMANILKQGLKFRPTNKVEEYGIDCQLCIDKALSKYRELKGE